MARVPLLAALLLASCANTSEAPSLRAGVAAIDITPDWPVALGGYGNRRGALCKGVHDRVFAKALYLESGERRVVLITSDLLGSLRTMRDAVSTEFPPSLDIVFTASHSHSAPGALVDTKNVILTFTVGSYDRKLFDWTRERFVTLIRAAIAAAEPATVAIASVDAPEFNRNRRSEHYPPGAAPVDPALGVMRVGRALVVNYTAHPTVLDGDNMLISADWPGALQRNLETDGVVAMFTNGAEGDMSPAAPGGADRFERCERLGAAMAARVRAIPLPAGDARPRLRYVERELDLPKPSMKWAERSVIGVLEIGDAAMVCVPGELACDLGLELKRRFRATGWSHVWILGLANDHLFYILSEEQWKKGGYERQMSFYGPKFGHQMVEELTDLGRRMRNSAR